MKTTSLPPELEIQQPCRKYGMDEAIHPVQIAAIRRATPGEKFAQIIQMYRIGISLKMAGLRMQHPEWTKDQLRQAAQRIAAYGTSHPF